MSLGNCSLHPIILPSEESNNMYMIRFDFPPNAFSRIQKLDFSQASNLSQDQIIMC